MITNPINALDPNSPSVLFNELDPLNIEMNEEPNQSNRKKV